MDFEYAATHCCGCGAEVPKIDDGPHGPVLAPLCSTCQAEQSEPCPCAYGEPCRFYGEHPDLGPITDADIPF